MSNEHAYHNESAFLKQILQRNERTEDFVPLVEHPLALSAQTPKVIAFYLPQFHTFPENDAWWGRGFTEWTNVTKALPVFYEHYQPRLPIDVGFYDLRVAAVVHRQIALAQLYGLSGFCFHYYWFSRRKLMETPIENYLKNAEFQFPFCINWANEPWSRRWNGSEQDVLMQQLLRPHDARALIDDLAPFFHDGRYITVDGKPFFMLYRPNLWEKERVQALTDALRHAAQKHGFPDLYLVCGLVFGFNDDPRHWGFDAGIEFPPHHIAFQPLDEPIMYPDFRGRVYDARAILPIERSKQYPFPVFRTVFPSWDNTARIQKASRIFHHSTPQFYNEWLSMALEYAQAHNDASAKFVFVNAWNEWAEGAHLEPDSRYGYAYLQATRDALIAFKTDIS